MKCFVTIHSGMFRVMLHLHLTGKVRAALDKPAQWGVEFVRKGELPAEALETWVDVATDEGRERTAAAGGRKEQYLRLGRERAKIDDDLEARLGAVLKEFTEQFTAARKTTAA